MTYVTVIQSYDIKKIVEGSKIDNIIQYNSNMLAL